MIGYSKPQPAGTKEVYQGGYIYTFGSGSAFTTNPISKRWVGYQMPPPSDYSGYSRNLRTGGSSASIRSTSNTTPISNTSKTIRETLNLTSTPEPEDLQVNSATENRPVPVVFGTAKITGNFLRYDNNRFRVVPLTKTTTVPGTGNASVDLSAGKGGGTSRTYATGHNSTATINTVRDVVLTQIVGYKYYLTFDLGICVGPIDTLQNITVTPGDSSLIDDTPISFDAVDKTSVSADDNDGFNGTVYLYNGAADQTRYASDIYAAGIGYRGTCFAHFRDFCLGESPSPKTVSFEVTRLPRCTDAAGTALTDFPVRGSDDTDHPSYSDANPAAILWELLTNENWGAAIPRDYLDEESFRVAAQYYAANDIGLSLTLASGNFLDEITNHITETTAGILVWTGDALRMTVLTDTDTAHATAIRLTEDQTIRPQLNRGSWASTFNEIRLSFVNRSNGHEPETVHVQDAASINALGRVQSTQVDTPALANREVAEITARRMLNQIAYPKATLTFEMTRYAAGIEPGALIEFVVSSLGDPITTYWRVSSMTDRQTSGGTLRLTCTEDLLAVGFRGVEDIFDTPSAPYLAGEIRTPEEIALGDDNNAEEYGDFGPGRLFEPPGTMTAGKPLAIMGIQRQDGITALATMTWEIEGTGESTALQPAAPWAILGNLDGAVEVTRRTARSLEIDVALEYEGDTAEILSACAYLETAADDYADLTAGPYCLLFVGSEIMRVGWAEDMGSGTIRFSGILRGDMGTEVEAHADGAPVLFLTELKDANLFSWNGIDAGETIQFDADQRTNRGTLISGGEITFTHVFTGRSLRPPPPRSYGTPTKTGSDWAFSFRPSLLTRGAGTQANISADLSDLLTDLPANIGFRVIGYNSSGSAIAGATVILGAQFESAPAYMPAALNITAFRFVPDTGQKGTCLVQIAATPSGTVATMRVFTILDGIESADYLSITP